MNENNDEVLDFGTRKGTKDKLTYKQVLYNVVMQYLNNYDKLSSRYAVERIVHATCFNATAMNLKKEINGVKEDTDFEKDILWVYYEMEMGAFDFNRRIIKTKIKLIIDKWYWDKLFDRILQVLVDNQVVVEIDKIQRVRMKKKFSDQDDGTEFEESVTDLYD